MLACACASCNLHSVRPSGATLLRQETQTFLLRIVLVASHTFRPVRSVYLRTRPCDAHGHATSGCDVRSPDLGLEAALPEFVSLVDDVDVALHCPFDFALSAETAAFMVTTAMNSADACRWSLAILQYDPVTVNVLRLRGVRCASALDIDACGDDAHHADGLLVEDPLAFLAEEEDRELEEEWRALLQDEEAAALVEHLAARRVERQNRRPKDSTAATGATGATAVESAVPVEVGAAARGDTDAALETHGDGEATHAATRPVSAVQAAAAEPIQVLRGGYVFRSGRELGKLSWMLHWQPVSMSAKCRHPGHGSDCCITGEASGHGPWGGGAD